MRKILRTTLATVAGLTMTAVASTPVLAQADPPGQTAAPDISVDDVMGHLDRFQRIADANGGDRSSGSPGYAASADYVAESLEEAGFNVTRQTCTTCTSPDDNIIADWPGGDASSVIMLGGHLDGVRYGPGINDNGSGSAALLEVALTLAENDPATAKHVRFGWWADEERGLNGSQHYVASGAANDVEAYLNFDMVGSPNAGYFLNGSQPYTDALGAHLTESGKPPEPTQECCTDDIPFQRAGIPTAGLFTGAGATKTPAQAQKWGGTAYRPFDPCYHSSCDSYPSNINAEALDIMSDAIAVGLWELAVDDSYSPARR
ncbi:M20/M25/M40 family metallo-hydrolase [Salininema proteolyticum]|uniref:M20/M25/M40 family metallo-hydrolase n=1 Tax=Salininema proteolyticum TaxID=1607685 RepID=A0ABV8TVB6_9ACTN